ncbi:hypothetical protein Sjap_024385 [Stephania japonica]|uniref:O-methyltransferase n=1 Tax=Stephania japonica TaxID=461633 RepID=A0AAP0EKJ0_9MAGN|nr:COMT protein [Stephania japonica]
MEKQHCGDDAKALLGEENFEQEIGARARVWKHMFAYIETILLRGAVQLGIPDHIHKNGGPMTLRDLAAKLPVEAINMSQLHQVMRYMVHMKLFMKAIPPAKSNTTLDEEDEEEEEEEEDCYGLTPVSELLVRSHERSLAPLVEVEEPDMRDTFAMWAHLIEGLDRERYPKTFWEAHYGMPFYEVIGRNPEWSRRMSEGMTSITRGTVDAVVHGLVREKVIDDHVMSKLVDVGGNTGDVAKAILRAFPQLKCTVMDLPHVVEYAPKDPDLRFVAGDMLQFVPSAHIVLLKSVLHNHEDDVCIKILNNCKEAILRGGSTKGKVILVEIVLDIDDRPELTNSRFGVDLRMVSMGGKERSKKEWADLFFKGGFSRHEIIPIAALESIVVLYP